MGLVKTVFSPLTNTTPLVTIILVIVLVAIFRFSGGGISIGDVKNHKAMKTAKVTKNIEESPSNELQREGTIKVDAVEFDRMLRMRPQKKREEVKKDKPVNNFDSIEADLGLR